MTSYQHQYTIAPFYKDSVPDFLTCGFCSSEFLLENITLFIAHKTGCSEKIKPTAHNEDTCAPLTCSSCSRVFMTARGLLTHVQHDHQMKICLQKGPLLLPEPVLRPPPAHLSVNGNEYTTTDTQKTGQPAGSDHADDEPTDLSMSCCNSLGKATVRCTEEECRITIEPSTTALQSCTTASLPKKRKFLVPESSSNTPDPISGDATFSDDAGNKSDGEEPLAHVTITAEYQDEMLASVSMATSRNDSQKNAKLKQLLMNKPTNEAMMHSGMGNFEDGPQEKTKLVYKFPAKHDKNQATPRHGDDFPPAECMDGQKFSDQQAMLSRQEPSPNSGLLPVMRFVPGSTLEQNIDQLIRASISSEELELMDDLGNCPPDPGRVYPSPPRLLSAAHPDTPADQNEGNHGRIPQLKIEDVSVTDSFSLPINVPCPLKPRPASSENKSYLYSKKSFDAMAGSRNQLFDYPHDTIPFSYEHRSEDRMKAKMGNALRTSPPGQPDAGYTQWQSLDDPFHVGQRSPLPRSNSESTDEALSYDPSMDTKMMKKRRYPTCRPFKCAHCDQAFNQRIHLKKHMSKHTGVKPFKCQQCDYSTVERSHLKVHYRIHTGEKPYRCMFCDYATAQNSTLKIHLKRHHDGRDDGQHSSDNSRSRDSFQQQLSREEDDSLLGDACFFVSDSLDKRGSNRVDPTHPSHDVHRPGNRPTRQVEGENKDGSYLPRGSTLQDKAYPGAEMANSLPKLRGGRYDPGAAHPSMQSLNLYLLKPSDPKLKLPHGDSHPSLKLLSSSNHLKNSLTSDRDQEQGLALVKTEVDTFNHRQSEATDKTCERTRFSPEHGTLSLKQDGAAYAVDSGNFKMEFTENGHRMTGGSQKAGAEESGTGRHVGAKTDSHVVFKPMNENEDEMELDYRVNLPSVNIPNKAFVRG